MQQAVMMSALCVAFAAGGRAASMSPRAAPAQWTFALERTIAPPFGGSGALAKPYDLGVTRDGRIIVLDRDVSGMVVYGIDGKFDRVIGARGHGPGEFSQFARMDVRGDTIALYDDGVAIVWRADGSMIRQWRTPPCSCSDPPVLDGRGNLLVPMSVTLSGVRRSALARWTLAGTQMDTLVLPVLDGKRAWLRLQSGGMVHLPFGPMRVGTFDSKLRYIHGLGTDYSLVIAGRGTDTVRVIHLSGERPAIPSAMRDSAYAGLMKNPDVAQVLKLGDLDTHQPMFLRLEADEADNIWIGRPNGRGAIEHFDVIGPDGRLIATANAPPGQPMKYTPLVFRSGRMYRLSENLDGEPVIQVFRIAH